MNITRRDALMLGAGAIVAPLVPFEANAIGLDEVTQFTGGAEIGEGGVSLSAPEIAENGNSVPIEVDAPGAEAILVVALGNPEPKVATFKFGKLAASHAASTRVRLATTQDVVAIAKMSDGTFVKTASTVKVTIGGCGG